MAKCILRTAKLKSGGSVGGSMSHNFRTRTTHNADQSRSEYNHLFYEGQTQQQAFEKYKEALPAKYRKDAVTCLEYFIGASPEYFEQGGGVQFFNQALRWLSEKHGSENLISAGIHFDETTPHMWAYVVPKVGDKLNCKHFTGGRKKLSDMQTDFHQKVGKEFGLERGIEGSKAHHTSIKQYYDEVHKAKAKSAPEVPTSAEYALAASGVYKPESVKVQEESAMLAPGLFFSASREKQKAEEEAKRAKASREKAEKLLVEQKRMIEELEKDKAQFELYRSKYTAENIDTVVAKYVGEEVRNFQRKITALSRNVSELELENKSLQDKLNNAEQRAARAEELQYEAEQELQEYKPQIGPGM